MECRASIVIPAHNEEHRIRSLLQSLSEASLSEQYAVFVICNGCTDRTREVAEEFHGMRVVEIEDVGKHFALNEGDRLAGDIFPRLYCDADIRMDPSSFTRLVDQLTTDQPTAAGPTVRYGVERCSWGIKKYYQALEIPIMTKWLELHLVGRGVYGASREARKRFDEFPPLFADDKFFDSQYNETEKVVVPGALATIWTPATIRALIRNETRVAKGNRQLAAYRKDEQNINDVDTTTTAHVPRGPLKKLETLRQWSRDIRLSDCVPLTIYLSVAGMTRLYLVSLRIRQRQVSWRS
jgi:glycosyltransferase involved in cell wall biosynthesis